MASSAEYRAKKTQRKKKNIATPNNDDANKGDPNNDSFIIRPKFQCLPTERNLACHTSLASGSSVAQIEVGSFVGESKYPNN